MPTVEQTLNSALEPHRVVVRFVAKSGGRRFYARRDYERRGVYAPPAPYDISHAHPWPRKAQVEDPEWLMTTVKTLLRELDAFRDRRLMRSPDTDPPGRVSVAGTCGTRGRTLSAPCPGDTVSAGSVQATPGIASAVGPTPSREKPLRSTRPGTPAGAPRIPRGGTTAAVCGPIEGTLVGGRPADPDPGSIRHTLEDTMASPRTRHMFGGVKFRKTSEEIRAKAKDKADLFLQKIAEREQRVIRIRAEFGITDQDMINLLSQAARESNTSRATTSMTYSVSGQQGEVKIIGAGVVQNLLTEQTLIEEEKATVQHLLRLARNLKPVVHYAADTGVSYEIDQFDLSDDELEFLGF